MEKLPSSSEAPKVSKTADEVVDMFNEKPAEKVIEKEEKKEEKLEVKEEKKEGKEEKEEKEEKIELKEEDDEEKEEKLDLKEEKEEKEEKLEEKEDEDKLEVDAPPRKQEILKAFPEIFKKFPWFEKMFYRDKQWNEMFGSFDEAKELVEKAQTFNDFEKDLLSGNTESVLSGIKEADSKAFDKVVDNYLISLAKVDKEAYFEVINSVGKRYVEEMYKEGKTSKNEEMMDAAVILNQFLFGSSEYVPHKPRTSSEKSDEKENEVEKERAALKQERFEESVNDLQTKSDNVIKNTLEAYIDQKNVMTSYVKRNAVNDALNLIKNALAENAGVKSTLNKLWKQADEANYSRESLDKIKSFYLGKAKQLMPAALKKVRAEALKDSTPRKEEKEEKEEKSERVPSGKPSSHKREEGMKKGESVEEYFAR